MPDHTSIAKASHLIGGKSPGFSDFVRLLILKDNGIIEQNAS
jgi:hypothetical protein